MTRCNDRYVCWVETLNDTLLFPVIAGIASSIYGICIVALNQNDYWLGTPCKFTAVEDANATNATNATSGLRWSGDDDASTFSSSNGTFENVTLLVNGTETMSALSWEALTNNEATPVFALIICIWCTFFTESWKRVQITRAVEWDVTQLEEEERPRPAFTGKTRPNIVTQEPETYMGVGKKIMLMLMSYTVSFTFLVAVMISLVGVVTFRITLQNTGFPINSVAPAMVSTGTIYVFGELYKAMAYKLNDLENHRTQTEYNDALINKLFMFSFVNNFTPLFYLAYFRTLASKVGMWGSERYVDEPCVGDCMSQVSMQVAVLLVGTPLIKTLADNVLPQIIDKFKEKKILTWYESEKSEKAIDISHDPTIHEYESKMLQYALVTLFACTMPLAPLIYYFLNKFDLRLDAGRLLIHGRRAVATRAEDIGQWQTIMSFINVAAVFNNGLLMAYTARFGCKLDEAYGVGTRLWFVIIFEHAVFICKHLIASNIPDIPAISAMKLKSVSKEVRPPVSLIVLPHGVLFFFPAFFFLIWFGFFLGGALRGAAYL